MTQTISREASRASAIARAAVLSISIFHVAISFGGTIYYYVGASNDWWNAASYSTTTSASDNKTMPGSQDSVIVRTTKSSTWTTRPLPS